MNILNKNYLQSQQSQGQGQQLLNYLSIFRKVKILSNHINVKVIYNSPKLSTMVRLVEASENDLKWCKCQDQGQELLLSSIVRKVEFYKNLHQSQGHQNLLF